MLLARLPLGWCLGIWILEGFLAHLQKNGSLCLNCARVVYTEHLTSSWVPGALVCARQEVPPVSTLGTESPVNLPGIQYCTCVVVTHCWRNSACLVLLHIFVGRRLLDTCVLLPLELAPFPSADFALYPFAVLSHSCGCDYTLSPVSPSSKPPNPRVVSGTHDTLSYLTS